MDELKRGITVLLLSCLFVAPALCGEDAPPAPLAELGEAAFVRAEMLFSEGDTRGALKLLLQLLRKGKVEGEGENYRESAREFLISHGLTAQELFKLEPDALSEEDLDKLALRVNASRARQKRQEIELAYGRELAEAAVELNLDEKGALTLTVREADLAKALSMLFGVALGEGAGPHVTDAQGELEALGVIGAKVEAAQKAAAEGKLPEEVKAEAVAVVLCRKLQHYREVLDSEPDHEDLGDAERRKVVREFGEKILKYVALHHTGSPALEHARETLDWWRQLTGLGPQPGKVEKF